MPDAEVGAFIDEVIHGPNWCDRMKWKKTAAEKRARREHKKKFVTIFINGKQKKIRRPPLIDGMLVEEFVARNADPIWLHENGDWDLIPLDERTPG